MASEQRVPDQPDGIVSDSFDLPEAGKARVRVEAFLEWYGDGRVATDCEESNAPAPLYARDLQALVNNAWERDVLLWLHAEAVWLGQVVEDTLKRALSGSHQRIHELVDEKQAERSSRQAWAEEAGRLGKFRQMVHLLLGYNPDITADSEALRGLEKLALAWQRGHTAPWSEVERLRREVEFEANGAATFSGADAIAERGRNGVAFAVEDFGLDVDTDAGGIYISLNHRRAARTEDWGPDVSVDYDVDVARKLAPQGYHCPYLIDPETGWVRLGMCHGEPVWLHDDVRGAACVIFNESDDPPEGGGVV